MYDPKFSFFKFKFFVSRKFLFFYPDLVFIIRYYLIRLFWLINFWNAAGLEYTN